MLDCRGHQCDRGLRRSRPPPQSPSSASATTSAASAYQTHTDETDSSEWYALGCAIDSDTTRVLTGPSLVYQPQMTIDTCLTWCEDQGYAFAGVEWGQECYCGNTVPSTITYSDSLCTTTCTGDASEDCGGLLGLDLYELISSATACPVNSTTNAAVSGVALAVVSSSTTMMASATTASASLTATQVAAAAATTVAASTDSVPSSGDTHYVWAHHMVGNTYPYQVSDWLNDINLAHSNGIDGFALNMGSDYWQPSRVADAFTAAGQIGYRFQAFLVPRHDLAFLRVIVRRPEPRQPRRNLCAQRQPGYFQWQAPCFHVCRFGLHIRHWQLERLAITLCQHASVPGRQHLLCSEHLH